MSSVDPDLERDIYYALLEGESRRALRIISNSLAVTAVRDFAVDKMSYALFQHDAPTEAFFLAVSIYDHYLESIGGQPATLLDGMVSALIAEKIEADDDNYDFESYSLDLGVSPETIIGKESEIFAAIGFNAIFVTIYDFLSFFLSKIGASNFFRSCALYLAEFLCLSKFRSELPSKLACMAIYAVNVIYGTTPAWSDTLQELTNYTEEQLQILTMKLLALLRTEKTRTEKSLITQKYSEPYREREAVAEKILDKL